MKKKLIIACKIITVLGLIIGIIIALFNILNNNNDDDLVDKKPIIYLYPTEKTELTITLGKPDNLTTSYPKYKDRWTVIANPDGTLIDTNTGKELYSLYWEGKHTEPIKFDEGFIVKSDKVLEFLEEKLPILGLNAKETEEFIIYWLPELQKNKYNYIRFANIEEINNNMPLKLSKKPDTMIRVLMQYKKLNKPIKVSEQELKQVNRIGFTLVEWGGTKIQ